MQYTVSGPGKGQWKQGKEKQRAWCDWITVRAAAKEREASGKRKCHGIIFQETNDNDDKNDCFDIQYNVVVSCDNNVFLLFSGMSFTLPQTIQVFPQM